MQSTIISIGNSKGVRIPKPLLKESGIDKYVDILVKKGEIKIVPSETASPDFGAASETSFAKDWLRPEEEAAWKVYQKTK